MAWLPNGEKISKIYLFVLTELTNVTDGQTDRRTPHDRICRAYICIASRGKNDASVAKPNIAAVRNDRAMKRGWIRDSRKMHDTRSRLIFDLEADLSLCCIAMETEQKYDNFLSRRQEEPINMAI